MDNQSTREYNEDQLKFKETWINTVANKMDNHSPQLYQTMSKIFDDTFNDNTLELYNSVHNETFRSSSTKYYNSIKNKHIINENGVLTTKHKYVKSPIEEAILGGILGRQVQKRKKQQFIKEDKLMDADSASIFEYTLKVLINGLYGLHLYPGSPFFNITLGATCTAAARNMVAVAAIVIELLEGGFRNYQVQAHIKMIETCKKESAEICSKYELIDVDVEDVLKVLLGHYYDNYYAKTFLREQLKKCNKETLQLLYIKNNIFGFMQLKRVKEIFKEILKIQRDNPGNYLANPKSEPYKDLMAELYKMSSEILYGFYYYDGDYDGKTGVYYDTLVDIIENIKRKKIVLMDTDSCVSTFQRETNSFLEEYKGLYDETDPKITYGVIPSIICWIYMGCVSKSLTVYVMELGVDYEHAKMVELEMEHMMSQLQLSLAKKSYVFIPVITDFFMLKMEKLKLKGVSLIKSNFNPEFCHMGIDILKKKIVQPLDKIDHKQILFNIKDCSNKAVQMLRSDDFILNKRTTLKINSETLSFSDFKQKSVNLWNRLYPEHAISTPGSFGVVLLQLDNNKVFNIKERFPREYKIISKLSLDIDRYKDLTRALKKFNKTSYTGNSAIVKKAIGMIKLEMGNREHEYIEELYKRIYDIYNGSSESDQNEFVKTMGFMPNNLTEASPGLIIDSCQRIAIPLDQNNVPDILKMDNYSILDISASSEVEHTISPLASTISLIITKNKEGRNTITSVLNSF